MSKSAGAARKARAKVTDGRSRLPSFARAAVLPVSSLALALFCGMALAAEPAAPPPKQPAAAPAPQAQQADAAADEKPEAADQEHKDGKAAAGDKASPQRFVPSEQVRADFDVSFPIDI